MAGGLHREHSTQGGQPPCVCVWRAIALFACLANGYPRTAHLGLPDLLLPAEAAVRAGSSTRAEFLEVADDFVHEIAAEQVRAGLSLLADGGVRHPDRLLPLIEGLGGLVPGSRGALPSGEPVTRPVVAGGVTWTAPITVDDWQFLAGLSDLPAKQVLLGPYTIGRMAEPSGRSRESTTIALAEALNREILALVAAGCPLIQIDEDAAAQIGDEAAEWALFGRAHQALTAGLEGGTLHLAFGAPIGAVARAGYAAILDAPYRSVLFDALAGPEAWRFAFAVPPDVGLIAGVVDAHDTALDEIEPQVWAMAWAAAGERGEARVGIAPNGSLAAMNRFYARRKIDRLGEAIKIAAMGPLADIANALDPAPLTTKRAELRVLAEAVEAARHG